tara:strand:+ start:23584 stop:24189 length:606 start_codon:yes stop_codon:yes gene_type:complete
MKDLTKRQREILQLVKENIKNFGFPPTRADISRELGFKSPNAAEQHLRAIEKKGFISILSGASRGIVLNDDLSDKGTPVVGLVAAGQPILAQENINHTINIPNNLFRELPDYLLEVRGDSMIDLGIHDNDLIAVKKQNECKEGQVIVARVEEEVTVKTFKKDKNGKVILEPANKAYKNIYIDPSKEEFYLEGICVGVIKSF